MSPTALLYPSGIDKCPWQYRKINGTWHRRPVNTNGDWAALHIKRIGTPPDNGQSKGSDNTPLPSINEWTWE